MNGASPAHATATASLVQGLRRHAFEIASLGLICAVFWSHLLTTFTRTSDDYEIAVSYITVFLVWQKRKALAALVPHGRFWAAIPLGLVLLLSFGINPTMFGANATLFVFSSCAWLLLCFGWEALRILAFPIGFYFFNLFFFIKLFSLANLGLHLRFISTRAAAAILSIAGQAPQVRGTQIQIGEFISSVDPVCSGLNNLFAFIIVGSLVAYYSKTTMLGRSILFLSTIPIAILANGLRVALLIILCKAYGSLFESGFWHHFVGVATFALGLCFFPLLLELTSRAKKT